MKITGSLIEAYCFCPKQAWLLIRQITGNQYNEFLEIGRLISEESYKNDKKEILIKGGKIDIIRKEKGEILLIEVKKSNKNIECAEKQLLFYIFKLQRKGYNVTGEIHIPKIRKVVDVILTKEKLIDLKNTINEISNLFFKENAPLISLSSKCKGCSYYEFCWS